MSHRRLVCADVIADFFSDRLLLDRPLSFSGFVQQHHQAAFKISVRRDIEQRPYAARRALKQHIFDEVDQIYAGVYADFRLSHRQIRQCVFHACAKEQYSCRLMLVSEVRVSVNLQLSQMFWFEIMQPNVDDNWSHSSQMNTHNER